jgi:hypothetical protein
MNWNVARGVLLSRSGTATKLAMPKPRLSSGRRRRVGVTLTLVQPATRAVKSCALQVGKEDKKKRPLSATVRSATGAAQGAGGEESEIINAIPLARTEGIVPFVSFLDEVGASTKRLLTQARLSPDTLDRTFRSPRRR